MITICLLHKKYKLLIKYYKIVKKINKKNFNKLFYCIMKCFLKK